MTKIETDKSYGMDEPKLYVWGPPNLHGRCFFLVEEQSNGGAGAGGPAQGDHTSIFFGVKLSLSVP